MMAAQNVTNQNLFVFSDRQSCRMKERISLVEAVVPIPSSAASETLQDLLKNIPTYLAGAVASLIVTMLLLPM